MPSPFPFSPVICECLLKENPDKKNLFQFFPSKLLLLLLLNYCYILINQLLLFF